MAEAGARAVAVAVPASTIQAEAALWPLLAAAAATAAIAPLWISELLPFQDAPQHLAAIRVLADYHAPGLQFEKWFEIDLNRLQYLGFYLPAAALSRLVGPDAACRICLSVIALALPAAFWMLLGALGRDRRLAVFAPAVFHTTPLYLGFFNFVESIPAAMAVVALTERELRAPTISRALLLAAGAAALLWLHPSALAFAIGAAAVLAITSGAPRRRIAHALAPYLPALALIALWTVQALAARDGPGTEGHTAPHWMGLRNQVLELLRFGNVLAGTYDELFAIALIGLFAAVVLVKGRPRQERWWRVPLLAALTLAVFLVAPYDMGYMGYIHLRALPFLVLLVIASPLIAPGRATGAILAAVVALQVAYAAHLASVYRAFDREAQVTQLGQVLHAAEPGKRLIAILDGTESRVVQFQAYLHFSAYYELLRGGRARYNFAETPWTPVRFRKGEEPVPLPRSWELRPFDLDLGYATMDEDYALVKAPGPRPPGFVLRARAGIWSLYEATRR